MFKRSLPATVVAALAVVCMAAAAPPAEPQFSGERIKAHVTFLADDLLEGREAGTRGHELAARYVAGQFALMGLKPGGDDGTFYQSVTLVDTKLTSPKPTVTITGPKGSQILTHRVEALVSGPTGGGEANIEGPAVYVGYGQHDKALGIDDYAGLDVRGKIVVVLAGAPKGQDSEIAAHLASRVEQDAAEQGAIGMIWIPTREMAKGYTWKQAIEGQDHEYTTWAGPDGKAFDPSANVRASAGLDIGPQRMLFEGAPRSLDQVLDEEAAGQRPKGFALKTRVAITAATRARSYASPEVIGIIEGTDPVLKHEYVMLMGHLDHLGKYYAGKEDGIFNGALDNAAGVATLLEVARALAASPPRRSILIIAHTAEEKGLLGAEYFAHHPTVPLASIVAGIDIDMPVLTYEFSDVIAYGVSHSTMDRAFERAAGSMGVTLSPDPTPDEAIFVRSDHYAMVKAGVPAVMLATGHANGGKAAREKFDKEAYHRPGDDLSQPILWTAGARFAQLNYRVIRDIADADQPPRWYEGDYFGNTFAPAARKAPRGR